MKASLILLLTVLAAGSVTAQPKKEPDHSAKTDVTILPRENVVATMPTAKPNEIVGHKVIYSGIVVQLIKTKEPSQLINPFVSTSYGSGEQNLDRDLFTHRPAGFKIFSINF